MTARARVVFVGPMGTGKTRLGKRVARLIGEPFADTDALVVAEHGPIARIFDTLGESHFRRLEREAVARALDGGGVVSLGGGAVLDPATQADLASERVVLLLAPAETVAPRIGDGRRPLVRGGIADWERILAERRPIYDRLATRTIDTSSKPFDVLARDLAEWLARKERPCPN